MAASRDQRGIGIYATAMIIDAAPSQLANCNRRYQKA